MVQDSCDSSLIRSSSSSNTNLRVPVPVINGASMLNKIGWLDQNLSRRFLFELWILPLRLFQRRNSMAQSF